MRAHNNHTGKGACSFMAKGGLMASPHSLCLRTLSRAGDASKGKHSLSHIQFKFLTGMAADFT